MIDYTEKKYGYLTALEFIKRENKKTYWKCKCDCGKEIIIPITYLTSGDTKSCGCYRKKVAKNNAKTIHNMSKSRLYRIWIEIKRRCYNIDRENYKYYGGRGIIVCDEWKKDFMSFYNWAIKNGYKDNLTIDRINNDGNYEPNNCRWATIKEQNNNMRTNHYIYYENKKYTMSQFAEKYNIPYYIVKNRIRHNWSIDKILNTPIINKTIENIKIK